MPNRARLNILAALVLALGCPDDKKSSTGGESGELSSSTAATSTAPTTGGCASCENPEHICCAGQCVDPRNDPTNCG